MSMPHPSTPTVGPPASRAPSWVAASTPSASPLTTHTPRSPKAPPSARAASIPVLDALREPTRATAGTSGTSPLTKSAGGGSGISRNRPGYPASPRVRTQRLFPARSAYTASGSKFALSFSSSHAALSVILTRDANSTGAISNRMSGGRSPRRETRLAPTLACSSERKRWLDLWLAVNETRPPVVERLGEVLDAYLVLPGQICDRPSHSQDPVVTPPREPHPVYGLREQGLGVATKCAGLAQLAPCEDRVGGAPALHLRLPGPRHALPDILRRLLRPAPAQLLAREARDVHEQVYPVEQGAGDASLVAFDLGRRAPARTSSIARVAAGARVHRAHQREARRVAQRRRHPGDRDVPVLQWLAQHLERRPAELGELVEEEDAVVRQ